MGQERHGTGASWDRSVMGQEHHGTGASWNRSVMGQDVKFV